MRISTKKISRIETLHFPGGKIKEHHSYDDQGNLCRKICFSKEGRILSLWEKNFIKEEEQVWSAKTAKQIKYRTCLHKYRDYDTPVFETLSLFYEDGSPKLYFYNDNGEYYKRIYTKFYYDKEGHFEKKAVSHQEKYHERTSHHYDDADIDVKYASYTEYDAKDKKIFVKWISLRTAHIHYEEMNEISDIQRSYVDDVLEKVTTKGKVQHLHEEGFVHYIEHKGHSFLVPAYKKD
ncbi:MAG: hypothetical protein GXP45_00215 [bacterium]|nr:hypothetical protein [bacterium]